MKHLKDYIKLPKITYNTNKYYNDLILNDNYIESSFDNFMSINNITEADKNLYRYYINENFSEAKGRYYGIYRERLYESIVNSYPASDLMKKIYDLSDNINITNIQYVNKEKVTQFSFEVDKEDDLDNIFTDKIINLLHIYNYYLKLRTIETDENGNEHYKIVIEPYKPKDITSTVYNNLHGILYHITLLKTYKTKIKYKEIIPKWKGLKYKDEYRDGRIFFIGNNDEKTVQKQLQSIKSTSNLMKDDDVIVLKIDLNKYKYKLRFRIDSSASGYNAYFTEEPIPDYCITCLDLDTWKEIDKNNI